MEASELIERLEKATGPDREIDATIWYAFFRLPPSEALGDVSIPTLTRSLDAALAIVKRVLPGWQWLVRTDERRGAFVHLTSPKWEITRDDEDGHSEAYAPTPALALCLALLRARGEPNCTPQAEAETVSSREDK